MASGAASGGDERTPRRRLGGLLLAVASALVGIAAAATIPQPPWGVAAAILLALASVGVAVGLSLHAREPAGAPDAWSAWRARRGALVYGAFLLAASATTAVGMLVLEPIAALEPSRSWTVIVLFGICGAWLIAVGTASVPSPVASSDRPAGDPSVDARGWIRLGSRRAPTDVRRDWVSAIPFQLFQVPVLVGLLVPVLVDLGPWAVASAVAIAVAAVTVAAVVLRRRSEPPWIAPDGSRLRHGSREVAASELVTAVLSSAPLVPDVTERSLMLTLAARRGFRATVHLRRRGRLVLGEAETAVLLDLVAASAIELPHDQHDATGRFSKSFYPDHLTRAEAEAVVADPPGDGEPLPIRSW